MATLRQLATRLVELPRKQLYRISDEDIRAAIDVAKKLAGNSARKRQIAHIARLLNRLDLTPIKDILARLDASSDEHVRQFHQLEKWREQLLAGDPAGIHEICTHYPDTDRQHLRALVRNAIAERASGQGQTHFRRIFQYLKQLVDHA